MRRYCRLAGQLAGGDDGAAFPSADRALFQAINNNAAGQARRWVGVYVNVNVNAGLGAGGENVVRVHVRVTPTAISSKAADEISSGLNAMKSPVTFVYGGHDMRAKAAAAAVSVYWQPRTFCLRLVL